MKSLRLVLTAGILIATIAQSACGSPPAGSPSPSPVIPSSTPSLTPLPNPGATGVPGLPALPVVSGDYVIMAWNDLGMHCLNPTYDVAVLLPPYNNLWAQVVKRGNPPQIVSSGVSVEYRFLDNTYSYGKKSFGQFWDNAGKLFGAANLAKDTGLNLSDPVVHNGLAGMMAVKSDHFVAIGVPLTPYNDSLVWNPYQVAEITVKDTTGKVLARTEATAPISDEINCSKCHGANAFQDILLKHDKNSGTNLANQTPVLCASCHGDPALGNMDTTKAHFLSQDIHGFHSRLATQPACYDCHPGQQTQCSRSLAHTAVDGSCTTCHGNLANVSNTIATSGRIPWVAEPKCADCHKNVPEVDTGSTLYRNATGHGGLYCASCHSSPHAMVPSREAADNFQAVQYQNSPKTIASCGACHPNSRGDGANGVTNIAQSDFAETHGGANPERKIACNICHTSVSLDTTKWPHDFMWKGR